MGLLMCMKLAVGTDFGGTVVDEKGGFLETLVCCSAGWRLTGWFGYRDQSLSR